MLKDKRDLKVGEIIETPASIATKFIRQGFAAEWCKAAKKPEPIKKAKATRKKSTTNK